ncbi:MAG: hypothetical protein ACI8QC_000083 [Planctomycetota bacterium]|jgi:hypothetical protein
MLTTLLTLALAAPPQSTPRDLVHQWRLNPAGLEEGFFRDSIGELDLKAQATPTFIGEGEHQAIKLSGPNQWVGKVVTPEVLPVERFTVEAWVLVEQVTPYSAFLGAIEDNGEYERGFLLGAQKDRFVFAVSSIGKGRMTFVRAPGGFERNRWYHVAGVYDGEVAILYIDGAEVTASEEPAGPIQYHDKHQLVIGAYRDQDESFPLRGALADVRLYDRAIRGRLIARHAEEGRGLLPTLVVEKDERTGESSELVKLQPRIHNAISKGVEHLLLQQNRDGSWGHHMPGYRNGQTALTVYTLLKSGLATGHPSIKQGFAFLARKDPTKTYAVAVQLLALAATKNPAHKDWAERILDDLLEWENSHKPGTWGYPSADPDLSVMQYVALGFWAATEMGIEVDKATWQRLVDATLKIFACEPEDIPQPAGTRGRPEQAIGFSYRGNSNTATGSMTTASICIGAFAQRCTKGKFPPRFNRLIEKSRVAALDWLTLHWSINSNPGRGGPPHYYLYGLERVGGLLDMKEIGGHDWYLEGARFLVDQQGGEGAWNGESDTCFAILFLVRATGPTTGEASKLTKRNWPQNAGPIKVQVNGDLNLTMYIPGFDKDLLKARDAQEAKKAGLRVVKVEWLVDGEVIATREGDPLKAWEDERYPARWRAPREKLCNIQVRAHVVRLGDYPDGYGELEILESKVLKVPAKRAPQEFAKMASRISWRNVLIDQRVNPKSSSVHNDQVSAGRSVDGLEATHWLAALEDKEPWVRYELDRPTRVTEVILSSPNSSIARAGRFDAPLSVRIIVNGGKYEFEADLGVDDLLPTVIPLPRKVTLRTLEIHILTRRRGNGQPGITGFAEVGVR